MKIMAQAGWRGGTCILALRLGQSRRKKLRIRVSKFEFFMSEAVQYITNEQGERVGVLLDLAAYQRLAHRSSLNAEDPDFLLGLSVDELRALADCNLGLVDQVRLDDLVDRNHDAQLSEDEIIELDNLLLQADQLTILKARARYTLNHLKLVPNAS
jgi:hypothetical protein